MRDLLRAPAAVLFTMIFLWVFLAPAHEKIGNPGVPGRLLRRTLKFSWEAMMLLL